jgi:hypothetical protein
MRGRADAADRGEAADRDVAVVADDRQAVAALGQVVVEQGVDRAGLDGGRLRVLVEVEDLVHALHEHDRAALGQDEVVAGVPLGADLELLAELLALLDRADHVLGGAGHVRLERVLRLDLRVADALPVVAEAVDAVVRERLVALDLAPPGRRRRLEPALGRRRRHGRQAEGAGDQRKSPGTHQKQLPSVEMDLR